MTGPLCLRLPCGSTENSIPVVLFRCGQRRLAHARAWSGVRTLPCFPVAGNTLLPLVNAINRAPNDEAATEAIYEVRLTTSAEHLDESREARDSWSSRTINAQVSAVQPMILPSPGRPQRAERVAYCLPSK